MIDLLKKALYTGVGLVFLTRDKIEEVARKMAEDGKLSESEGKRLFDELLKKSEEAKGMLEKAASNAVNKTLEKLDIPNRNEIAGMEARLKEVEGRLQSLEGGRRQENPQG